MPPPVASPFETAALRPPQGEDQKPPASRSSHLLGLDAGVLDHLAPARFLARKIAVERVWRLCHHDQALIRTELLECLGLNGFRRRPVETVDDLERRLGRRVEAVPGFGGVAG